ncbi:MAG TPA: hypothetical protein VM260_18820, partial [Pirellula sp.]|nr:hypothetical protein [Pirellula sp.]
RIAKVLAGRISAATATTGAASSKTELSAATDSAVQNVASFSHVMGVKETSVPSFLQLAKTHYDSVQPSNVANATDTKKLSCPVLESTVQNMVSFSRAMGGKGSNAYADQTAHEYQNIKNIVGKPLWTGQAKWDAWYARHKTLIPRTTPRLENYLYYEHPDHGRVSQHTDSTNVLAKYCAEHKDVETIGCILPKYVTLRSNVPQKECLWFLHSLPLLRQRCTVMIALLWVTASCTSATELTEWCRSALINGAPPSIPPKCIFGDDCVVCPTLIDRTPLPNYMCLLDFQELWWAKHKDKVCNLDNKQRDAYIMKHHPYGGRPYPECFEFLARNAIVERPMSISPYWTTVEALVQQSQNFHLVHLKPFFDTTVPDLVNVLAGQVVRASMPSDMQILTDVQTRDQVWPSAVVQLWQTLGHELKYEYRGISFKQTEDRWMRE